MKFKITFKDPDAVDDATRRAIHDEIYSARPELYEDELESWREVYEEKCEEVIKLFTLYREYITVEFDTSTNTCRVVPTEEIK